MFASFRRVFFVAAVLSPSLLFGSPVSAQSVAPNVDAAQVQVSSLIESAANAALSAVGAASPLRTFHVGIQSGHWKNDELPLQLARLVGSVGTEGGGRTEVELNLDVSNRVVKLLQAAGVTVDLLPSTVPTGYSADAFVAIHADGSDWSAPRGYKISTRWSSAVALQDAELVNTLSAKYGALTGLPEDNAITRNMRGYYAYAPFRPNYRTSDYTPAAIVEMGYMSNSADRAVMFNQTQTVASAIAQGLLSFLKQTYGTPGKLHGIGYGFVDSNINPNAPALPEPSPSPSTLVQKPKLMQGDWQVYTLSDTPLGVYAEQGSGPLLGRLALNTAYHSTARQGDYYQVVLPSGAKGWVSRNYVIVQTGR